MLMQVLAGLIRQDQSVILLQVHWSTPRFISAHSFHHHSVIKRLHKYCIIYKSNHVSLVCRGVHAYEWYRPHDGDLGGARELLLV